MKRKNLHGIISLVMFFLLATQAWSENIYYSDSNYSIKIAVTINSNDNIIGRLEYSNHTPQYPIQLVAFGTIGGIVYSEPYLFEMLEKKIVSKNVHKIKCRSLNDKCGSAWITGTIDFKDETKPKIHLVNDAGLTYISNISEKGKETHLKYIPNVWLGH